MRLLAGGFYILYSKKYPKIYNRFKERGNMIGEERKEWFVLKTLNNRSTTVQSLLHGVEIETFIPLKKGVRKNRSGKNITTTTPIIPNLIFVNATRSEIWSIKNRYDFISVLYDRTANRENWGELMTIPTPQMEEFMAFVKDNYDKIDIIDNPDTLDLTKGEKVRITSGAFEGRVATYISIKGRRARQIVVKIDGFMAVVATSEFTCEKLAG